MGEKTTEGYSGVGEGPPIFINTLVFFRMLDFGFGLEYSLGSGAGQALGSSQELWFTPHFHLGLPHPSLCSSSSHSRFCGLIIEDCMWSGGIKHRRNHWITCVSLLVMLLELQAERQPTCPSESPRN